MGAEVLSSEEITRRVADLQNRAARARADDLDSRFTYGTSLLSVANALIDDLTEIAPRLLFGLPELDDAMRGLGRGELCYLTGKAYSGKTFILLHVLLNNPSGHFLYITPDETRQGVYMKLIGLMHGIKPSDLERRLKAGDHRIVHLLWRTAEETFPGLHIVDQALTFDQMQVALYETQDAWGVACDGCFVDYLDLLPGEANYQGTKAKSIHLKAWAKRSNVAVACIHQPRRGGAERGYRIGMDDMANAGETEATFVLGVYRKADAYGADNETMERHANTISCNLDKNKRTGRRVEVDYYLHPDTGAIRPLRPEDMVGTSTPITSARVAASVRAERKRLGLDSDEAIDLAVERAVRR